MNAPITTPRIFVRGYAATGRPGFRMGHKLVLGYTLMNYKHRVVAVIETTKPVTRIEELLAQYIARDVPMTARELMRDLLNTEDCYSHIYDCIVRIYYAE